MSGAWGGGFELSSAGTLFPFSPSLFFSPLLFLSFSLPASLPSQPPLPSISSHVAQTGLASMYG